MTRVEHVNKCSDLVEGPCAFVFLLGAFTNAGLCFKDAVSRVFALGYCVLPLPPCLPAFVSFGDLGCGLLCPAPAALSPGLDFWCGAAVSCRCRLVYRPCLIW